MKTHVLRIAVAALWLAVAPRADAATVTLPASCQSFTDDPVVAQATVVKAAHVTQLRTCIADLRVLVALPRVIWTDPLFVAGTTAVKAVHVTELRTSLSAVFTALGQPVPPFSGGPAAGDVIVAAHLNELRSVLPLLASGPTCSQAPAGLTPNAVSAGATGGQGTTTLGYPAGCPYTATSNASWLTIVAATTVSITYAIAANDTITSRTGTLTIGGLTFTVTQEGAAEVVTYVDTDAIGSVRMLTDAHGAVVLPRFDYMPFGTIYPERLTSEKLLFTGKEHDQESTFDYFGGRYYASQTGRLTTVDPGHVNGDIFDPPSWNGYAYARNNPLKYTDPTGTEYEICAEGAPSCQRVSDQYFAYLQRNPGAGIQLFGGYIYAGGRGVGTYQQTNIDWTFNDFFRQTGERADAMLKAGATEMAKNAVITAATFGVGLAARASVEVMLASRSSIVFKTGHYASRLLAAGVSVDRAETAVQGLIKGGAPLHGTVRVDGVLLEYRAMRLPDGRINVGTIFPQR